MTLSLEADAWQRKGVIIGENSIVSGYTVLGLPLHLCMRIDHFPGYGWQIVDFSTPRTERKPINYDSAEAAVAALEIRIGRQ